MKFPQKSRRITTVTKITNEIFFRTMIFLLLVELLKVWTNVFPIFFILVPWNVWGVNVAVGCGELHVMLMSRLSGDALLFLGRGTLYVGD